MKCTRRRFLQIIGTGAITALALDEQVFAESEIPNGTFSRSYGLLNDGTRCIGCHSCELACREYNQLPPLETGPDGQTVWPVKLDENTFTRIESREISRVPWIEGDRTFRRFMCNHCEHPSCASACPVGALVKSPSGPVYYRAERCIGCRYCINACPFSIPKYQWDTWKPFVRKCTMCHAKVSEGEPTSCASACPVGAIKFGTRDDLLKEAHLRIDEDPDRYNNYIFGENDVGGTNVLYLVSSAVPMEEFGFPMNLGSASYPGFTWAALSRVPSIALFTVFWISLVYFITHRRIPMELQESEIAGQASQSGGESNA